MTNTEKLSNTGFETDTTSWTAAAANLATNLTSYWKLTESSGTRADSVGTNNLTDNNTVTGASGGPPPPDGAWSQFTRANNEWLSVSSNPNLQIGGISFAVSYWMYIDSFANWLTPVSKWEGSTGKNEWSNNVTSAQKLGMWVSVDGTNITFNFLAAETLSTGTWYFVVAGYDEPNDQYFIQINNGTPTTQTDTRSIYNGTGTFAIGSEHNRGTTFAMNGRIASLGLWRRLLTTNERTTLYNSGNGLAYPFYTLTRDTTTTYNSSTGSAKIVAGDATNLTQSVNVGDTNTYSFSAYAYTTGAAVTSSDVQLLYNGSTVSTTYTSVGSGWYQLTGTVAGVASSVGAGVQVAAGKTVYLDNFSLNNYASSGTLTSSIFDTEYSAGAAWGTLTYNATTPSNTSVSVKARTSNSSSMAGATAFSSCTAITSGSDISSNSCVTDSHRYIQYQLSLANTDSVSTPTFADVSIAFSAYDSDAPSISLTALSPDPNSDSTPTLSGTATESIGTVSNVQFQMDATSGTWTACTAGDGAFNGATETFSCAVTTALTDGSHTIYVRATDSNGNTTSNANASTKTFTVDATAPASFDLDSPGNDSYTSNERPTFKWKATTDATSGLSSYTLEVDNGDSGDFSITGIPTSRTTDYDMSKYLVHYDNFSDSDSTNNYISIYTKSSSSWGSSENDGKLKEGSVGWKIKAIDAAGNERTEGRTLIVDLTGPVITTSGVGSDSPEVFSHDGYTITTNQTPSITGTITDNYSPDKVEVSIYKENYFLGVITSKELFTSLTYSLSNGANSKSLSFSIPVPDPLDYGSYEVNIKGTDKAGNKSALSTIYLKILTSRQAQELLQGKVDKEEKKTIQEKSQVSLPRLEEKAKERREKEAENLEKAMSPIAESLKTVTSVILEGAERLIGSIARVAGDAIASGSSMTGEGIRIAGYTIGNGLLGVTRGVGNGLGAVGSDMMAASNNFNQMVSNSQSVIANGMKQSLTGIGSEIAEPVLSAIEGSVNFLAMTIGQGYNNLAQSAPGIAGTVLTGVGNGAGAVAANLQTSANVILEGVKRPMESLAKTAGDAIAYGSSMTGEGIKIAASSASGVLLAMTSTVSDTTNNLNQTLTASQENVKRSINSYYSKESEDLREGISTLAFAVGERVQDVSDRAGFTIVKFGYLFVNEPTRIYDIQVATLAPTSAKVSWRTNHPANGKVNYGLDETYPLDIQTSKRTTFHEFTLTNLTPNTEYHFEVMSQNKNYVYDANRKFKTPEK